MHKTDNQNGANEPIMLSVQYTRLILSRILIFDIFTEKVTLIRRFVSDSAPVAGFNVCEA